MTKIKMEGYKVTELNFENKAQATVKFEVATTFQYRVLYADDNRHCMGECHLEVHDKENNVPFKISVDIVGTFLCDDIEDKKSIHNGTFKELFPYMRTIITNVSTSAGLPALVIPNIDIESMGMEIRYNN